MTDIRDLSPARLAALEESKHRLGALFSISRATAKKGAMRAAPPVFECVSCGCDRWRPDGGDVCVSCELARGRKR